MSDKPKITLVIPRGESVRNFLYSDVIKILYENAHITILTVIDDAKFIKHFSDYAHDIIKIKYYPEKRIQTYLRKLVHDGHFRWLWSEVARNRWETDDAEAQSVAAKIKRLFNKAVVLPFSNRTALKMLTRLEQELTYSFRPANIYDKFFAESQPDLVFNGSHIHGAAGSLPVRVASKLGIKTAGFIFSWDNLTSRSRIFEPYDYYLVWNDMMRDQLQGIYGEIQSDRIIVTGTPQFDFHFRKESLLSKKELCDKIGADNTRPFILYTAGIDRHFPDEYLHVINVINIIKDIPVESRPQLIVRMYVKGISKEMLELSEVEDEDVIFPQVMWEERWKTPMFEDQKIYSSLLKHCALGINAASTVSLELMIHDKPVINIGFDPPGSNLPHHLRWSRHIDFDHFKPVAESGAVDVARSIDDMGNYISEALKNPGAKSAARKKFISDMFDGKLDGKASERVANCLLKLAKAD